MSFLHFRPSLRIILLFSFKAVHIKRCSTYFADNPRIEEKQGLAQLYVQTNVYIYTTELYWVYSVQFDLHE